ncbi:MAG: hypothetical protein WBB39_01395 [Candidatus Saccharimonadales bacterium]
MASSIQLSLRTTVLDKLEARSSPAVAASISELRQILGLDDTTNKQLRRAIEALFYGGANPQLRLRRYVVDEGQPKGWEICKI